MTTSKELNDLFSQKLGASEESEDVEEFGDGYVGESLLEVALSRKVTPPRRVTKEEYDEAVITEDSLIKIVEVHHYDDDGNWLYVTSRRGEVGERYTQRCACKSHDVGLTGLEDAD
jgi:hypothetical protein